MVDLMGSRNFLWNEYASSRRELARKGGQQVTMGGVPWGTVDEDRLHELVKDERGVENLRAGLGFEAVQVVLERGESREDAARRMDRGEEEGRGTLGGGRGRVQPQADLDAARGHVLRVVGSTVFCVKCASHARARLGTGLKGVCPQPQDATRNATAARLRRLHQGLHPVTGRTMRG